MPQVCRPTSKGKGGEERGEGRKGVKAGRGRGEPTSKGGGREEREGGEGRGEGKGRAARFLFLVTVKDYENVSCQH